MFYKIIKDGNVIDVSDGLSFMRWQDKFCRMIYCSMDEAQAIQSSDGETVWHEISLAPVPVDGFDTVTAVPIDEREYRSLRALHCSTPEDIIDAFVLALMSDASVLEDPFIRLIASGDIASVDAENLKARFVG